MARNDAKRIAVLFSIYSHNCYCCRGCSSKAKMGRKTEEKKSLDAIAKSSKNLLDFLFFGKGNILVISLILQ